MTNFEIYNSAGLCPDEITKMNLYISGEDDNFYDSSAYEKLFEYFVFDIAEMPYGIAKARTGCPDEWILERLSR